ncbi:MAG: hypothetical protein KIT62_09880 [Cyclobacteriaceae bacterium]|nr:hypothetical protein [Cyclobacteriaceae bacterium]
MRFIRVSLCCFRLIAIPAVLITIACAAFLWMSGSALFLVSLFWTKVITNVLLAGFVYVFRSSRFCFFHNLGFSLKYILLSMILMDWFVALIVLGSVALVL